MITLDQVKDLDTELKVQVSSIILDVRSTVHNSLEDNDVLDLGERLIVAQAKRKYVQWVISKWDVFDQFDKILQGQLNKIYRQLTSTDTFSYRKYLLIMKAEAQIIKIILN